MRAVGPLLAAACWDGVPLRTVQVCCEHEHAGCFDASFSAAVCCPRYELPPPLRAEVLRQQSPTGATVNTQSSNISNLRNVFRVDCAHHPLHHLFSR